MSHLDLLRCVQRTLRRAEMPMAYSQGFNPHPLLSFAQAMGVGLGSRGDYFEVGLTEELEPAEFVKRFNEKATPGVHVLQARAAAEKEKTVMSQVQAAQYRFTVPEEAEDTIKDALYTLMNSQTFPYEKKSKSGVKQDDMRPKIFRGSMENRAVEAILSCGNDNLQPKAFWQALCKLANSELPTKIVRLDLFRREGNELVSISRAPEQP